MLVDNKHYIGFATHWCECSIRIDAIIYHVANVATKIHSKEETAIIEFQREESTKERKVQH